MTHLESARRLARTGGVFYLIIIVCAMFAYRYVRGVAIVHGDMAQTATQMLAHEALYRLGFSAAVVVVLSNLPLGWVLYELLKIVNPRLALLAFLFIIAATVIEAVNLFNYLQPLLIFTLPEYRGGAQAGELLAVAHGSIRMFGYGFGVSLAFFGVFCILTGFLILRARFLPRILGVVIIVAGLTHLTNNFGQFLALPIPYIPWVTLVAESLVALWLTAVGVNEANWKAQALASTGTL